MPNTFQVVINSWGLLLYLDNITSMRIKINMVSGSLSPCLFLVCLHFWGHFHSAVHPHFLVFIFGVISCLGKFVGPVKCLMLLTQWEYPFNKKISTRTISKGHGLIWTKLLGQMSKDIDPA